MKLFKYFLQIISIALLACTRASPNADEPGSDRHEKRPATKNESDRKEPKNKNENSYTEVGNGGDVSKLLVEEARLYAAAIISRIHYDSFVKNSYGYVSSDELSWISKNLNVIKDDILRSKLVWVDRHPVACLTGHDCGCSFIDEDKIFLNKRACESRVFSKREWAKLLIHESMHHFVGNDESKANRFGVTIYSAWYNMGHPDSPHWQMFKLPESSNPAVASTSVWTGNELAVWREFELSNPYGNTYPDKKLFYYNPATEVWRTKALEEPAPFFRGSSSGALSAKFFPAFIDNKINLFADPVNNFFTLSQGKVGLLWTPSSKVKMSPCSDYSKSMFSKGKSLALGVRIFYFMECFNSDSREFETVAAFFDLSTKSWTNVSDAAIIPTFEGSSIVTVGNQIAVIGAMKGESLMNAKLSGAIFDFQRMKWLVMNKTNAPNASFSPTLISTGSKVLLYGGYNQDSAQTFQRRAASFDVPSNTWKSLPDGPQQEKFSGSSKRGYLMRDPNSEINQGIWTGAEALFFIHNRVVSFNPFNRSWSEDSFQVPETALLNRITWTGLEVLLWDSGNETGFKFFP